MIKYGTVESLRTQRPPEPPTPEQVAFEAGWRAAVRNYKAMTVDAAYIKWNSGRTK